MRFVLAGGGSAGHIEPALALADALREADPGAGIVCLGTERGLETRLVPLRGYELALIPAVPLPRSVTPALMAVPGKLAAAVNAAAKVLDHTHADVLVGFGGYVATPGYLAARRRRVPVVVHEANPRPGLANRLGSRLTTHVFTGHPETELPHASYLGLPIRRQIAELDRLALGDKARAHFGLRPDLPVLLVTGGSQGAQSLNRAVFGAAGALRGAGVQVLHVVGPRNEAEIPAFPSGTPYVTVPYVDRMDLAYAAADFALCRAGAMTCAELTAVGLPGVYVPLPHGNGEQRLNAEPIAAGGGGFIVEDRELSAEWIRAVLLPILLDIDLVADMSEAAARLGRPDADRWLAEKVIGVARAAAEERAARERPGPGETPDQDAPWQSPPPGWHDDSWADPGLGTGPGAWRDASPVTASGADGEPDAGPGQDVGPGQDAGPGPASWDSSPLRPGTAPGGLAWDDPPRTGPRHSGGQARRNPIRRAQRRHGS